MTPEQIRAAIAAGEASLASLRALLPENVAVEPKVSEMVARYQQSIAYRELRSIKTEEGRLRLHVLRLLGDDLVSGLNASRIEWYRDQRRKEAGIRHGTTTSAATRNREVIRLSAALSWAAETKLIAANPIWGLPPETEDNQRSTCPTPADVNRVILACDNPRLRAMIATSFWTGVRRGELVALEVNQVEWDDGLIVLHRRQTKTREARITIFPDRASDMVRDYLDGRVVKSRFLFCTKSGAQVSARNYLRDFQAMAARAGVAAVEGENLVLHDLRSGFVGRQLELGTAEKTIMHMTGHSTHAAFDRYVRVQKRWLIEARERTELAEMQRAKRKPPTRAVDVRVDPSQRNASDNVEILLTALTDSGTA